MAVRYELRNERGTPYSWTTIYDLVSIDPSGVEAILATDTAAVLRRLVLYKAKNEDIYTNIDQGDDISFMPVSVLHARKNIIESHERALLHTNEEDFNSSYLYMVAQVKEALLRG